MFPGSLFHLGQNLLTTHAAYKRQFFRVRLRVELAVRTRGCLGSEHRILLCLSVCFTIRKSQKLRNRKSLALPSTFSRIARSGSMRAISTAPVIVEKIAKKARSLSATRRPGMKGTIRFL